MLRLATPDFARRSQRENWQKCLKIILYFFFFLWVHCCGHCVFNDNGLIKCDVFESW